MREPGAQAGVQPYSAAARRGNGRHGGAVAWQRRNAPPYGGSVKCQTEGVQRNRWRPMEGEGVGKSRSMRHNGTRYAATAAGGSVSPQTPANVRRAGSSGRGLTVAYVEGAGTVDSQRGTRAMRR